MIICIWQLCMQDVLYTQCSESIMVDRLFNLCDIKEVTGWWIRMFEYNLYNFNNDLMFVIVLIVLKVLYTLIHVHVVVCTIYAWLFF